MISCPECRRKISRSAKICPGCGKDMVAYWEAVKKRNAEPALYSSFCLVCHKLWNYDSHNIVYFNYSDSKFIIKHNWVWNGSADKKLALLRKLNPKEKWKPSGLFPNQTYEEQMQYKKIMLDIYDRCRTGITGKQIVNFGCYHVGAGCKDWKDWFNKKTHQRCVCKNCVPEYIKNPNVKTSEENDLIWYKNNTILILCLLLCWPIGFYALYKRWTLKK